MADLETRCKLTDEVEAFCSHCRNLPWEPVADPDADEREEGPSGRLGTVFDANFPGKCSGCGERFDAPEPIRADGFGGWVIADCCGGES